MNPVARRPRRAWAVLAACAIAATAGGYLSPVNLSAAADASALVPTARTTGAVTVTVEDVSPNVPVRSSTPQPITFTLALSNTTSAAINTVRVSAERGNPVTTSAALGETSLSPSTSSEQGIAIEPTRPVTTSLAAGATTTVTFSTTTSIVNGTGICECANAVYPLFFTASAGSRASPTELGTGSTYVPVAVADVPRTRVAWAWPLIDRPHRLTQNSVFTDDSLTGEVASAGRLDRALQVVEQASVTVPMTLVIDPELIDELAVMASGTYRVRTGRTTTTAGTGSAAAAAWLQRLHAVLTGGDQVRVVLTAFADPDIQSLVASGHNWRARMPSQISDRVLHALEGAAVDTRLTWPAGERLSKRTVGALAGRGTREVLVSSAGLATAVSSSVPPPGVVRLRGGSQPVTGLVTTPALTSLVADGVSTSREGARVLPRLMAELTVRALQRDSSAPAAVLIPPRYVDADVSVAERIIETTSTSTYSTSTTTAALADRSGAPAAEITGSVPASDNLPPLIFDAVSAVTHSSSMISSLLAPSDAGAGTSGDQTSDSASELLAELPAALQRVESSAWRSVDGLSPTTGTDYAAELSSLVDSLRNGVHIVPPSAGSYTLASGSSAIPVTVSNELDYPATVDVRLETVGGLTGLHTKPLESRTIDARTTVILRVPASIDRPTRIKVHAFLTAPNGMALGSPTTLTVRSTAFGKLGIIIMVVAGVLLLLALARRWSRSMRARRAGARTSPDVTGGIR